MKRLTEKRILNITLFYLSRYESSIAKVRAMLHRRLLRMKARGLEVPPAAEEWIEQAIQTAVAHSYLNDDRYAENQVRRLVAEGRSEHYITAKLAMASIDSDTTHRLLEATGSTEADRANRFVRRKRLGPYRPESERTARYAKDLAALARAGFSYEVADQALRTLPPTD